MDAPFLLILAINEFKRVPAFFFFSTFTNHRARTPHVLLYLALSGAVSALLSHAQTDLALSFVLETAAFWLIGVAVHKSSLLTAASAALLTTSVMILSNGIMNPIHHILGFVLFRTRRELLPFLGVVVSLASTLLAWFSYRVILDRLRPKSDIPDRYLMVFIIPVLLLLMMEHYFSVYIYGNTITVSETGGPLPDVGNAQIFLLQTLAYSSLFIVLYACRKLSEDYRGRMRLALLEQEVRRQKEYVREAALRHKQTQGFRHDIQWHLMVLNGFLTETKIEQAREYLDKLEGMSRSLSFPCRTGNTVIDTLLGNKLDLLRHNGIRVECAVKIPPSGAIDDFDLCVVFANALDNAAKACAQVRDEKRFIRISGKRKGDFFMFEFENSFSPEVADNGGSGIGLSNIEAVAQKYHGAVSVEKENAVFRLNVLLVIPRGVPDISGESA